MAYCFFGKDFRMILENLRLSNFIVQIDQSLFFLQPNLSSKSPRSFLNKLSYG